MTICDLFMLEILSTNALFADFLVGSPATVRRLKAEIRRAALAVYDYSLTVRGELTFFWRRKGGIASWLFFVNRYGFLLSVVAYYLPTHSYKVGFTFVSLSSREAHQYRDRGTRLRFFFFGTEASTY